jgi:hypothetical protein
MTTPLLPDPAVALAVFAFSAGPGLAAAAPAFERQQLEEGYYSEGASFGDLNGDGHPDAVSGPHWWEGPAFETKHTYCAIEPVDPDKPGYVQETFFSYVHDIDGDGRADILLLPIPGTTATWFRNPGGGGDGHWEKHEVLDDVGNESPDFTDALGEDGEPELWCLRGGRYGYAVPAGGDPSAPWTFHPVSGDTEQHKYTHGMGLGDLDGDGRRDVLLKDGWFQQPEDASSTPWAYHEYSFRPKRLAPMPGGSQMFAYDVDGDGDNDLVTSIAAHSYGLAWFEQAPGPDGTPVFVQHVILPEDPATAPDAPNFSQLHAVALADLDGDGLQDLVTGKCRYAHGPEGDPDPKGTPVLYAFLLRRSGGTATYEPLQIDAASGIGRQISTTDTNGDSLPDIIVGNKLGTFVFRSER